MLLDLVERKRKRKKPSFFLVKSLYFFALFALLFEKEKDTSIGKNCISMFE
jgi:hypothetical protein